MSSVKVSLSREDLSARPLAVRAGHAASTYLRRFASAFGAGSVAITSKPFARNSAAQPMIESPLRLYIHQEMFSATFVGGRTNHLGARLARKAGLVAISFSSLH